MTKRTDLPGLLTVEQASELLGLSRVSTYKAVHRGDVPSIRWGRSIKIPKARLLELLGEEAEQFGTASIEQ